MRIERHYNLGANAKVTIVPRKGESSLLCSADLSNGKMISAAAKLKEMSHDRDYDPESDDETAKTTTADSLNTKIASFH